MTATDQFDAIVIGTGQGGKPLAAAFAQAGWKTAIIERADLVGGAWGSAKRKPRRVG